MGWLVYLRISRRNQNQRIEDSAHPLNTFADRETCEDSTEGNFKNTYSIKNLRFTIMYSKRVPI